MVEGLKSGFYTTSSQAKKEGRKQENKTQQSSLSQPNSILNQQPGILQEEWKQVFKTTHIDTPISAEKPRKQMKSALRQEVTEFNPSGQMSMEQLIRVVLNLQEEVQKLKHLNEKLMLKLEEKNQVDESRINNYERQMDAFFNIQNQQDKDSNQLKNLVMKQNQEIHLLKESRLEQQNTGSIPMVVEPKMEPRMNKPKLISIRKRCFCCGSQFHLYRNCRKFQQKEREF